MPEKVKFLVVDDLDENILALCALLERDGLELLTARSGAEALELLLQHDVALAFFDVRMPEMNGFELAELVRGTERTRRVPIIFVTAGVDDQHRLFKGYEKGAVDFLHKPIEPHVLRSKADVFFELSRQKQQLAEDLRERTETLRLQEMFTAVLGHDLRNPLNALLLGADQLQRRSENEAVKKTAAQMQQSARRMMRMIQDLLDLTRARLAGGIVVKPEAADLEVIVQRALNEQQAGAPGLSFSLSREGDLTGRWDIDRLAQVTTNLLSNAALHGNHEGSTHVALDGRAAGRVKLTVTNGGEIPAELLPHVFDPFRGGTRPREERGDALGLGLYIVQQIVLAHGGTVQAVSGDGHTSIAVEFPRQSS